MLRRIKRQRDIHCHRNPYNIYGKKNTAAVLWLESKDLTKKNRGKIAAVAVQDDDGYNFDKDVNQNRNRWREQKTDGVDKDASDDDVMMKVS